MKQPTPPKKRPQASASLKAKYAAMKLMPMTNTKRKPRDPSSVTMPKPAPRKTGPSVYTLPRAPRKKNQAPIDRSKYYAVDKSRKMK